MDVDLNKLDWTLIQSFLAVVETGSLSGAARRLGQSQPTIGRHVRALETTLGVELFTPAPRGLLPSNVALELVALAREMAQAAARMQRIADGRNEDPTGTVRITASVVTSNHTLPEVISKMRQDLPQIQIELVPSDTTENLIFREADIAIRMYRPTQNDVITKHVCDQPTGLFAARTYLDRVGRPQTLDEAMDLDFVGFDKDDRIIRAMSGLGQDVTRDYFPVRCDEQNVYWALVRSGCGIGGMQTGVGNKDPLVEPVLADVLTLPALPMWLTAPEALRTTPRIRAVWDYLSAALSASAGA